MSGQEQATPRAPIIGYPQQFQLMQMQVALQECIVSLQHVYVQRHAIYVALDQASDMAAQIPQLDGSMVEIQGQEALDQAFARSSVQIQSCIANLLTRLNLFRGNSAQQQSMPSIPPSRIDIQGSTMQNLSSSTQQLPLQLLSCGTN